jgi:hypothetical protein
MFEKIKELDKCDSTIGRRRLVYKWIYVEGIEFSFEEFTKLSYYL